MTVWAAVVGFFAALFGEAATAFAVALRLDQADALYELEGRRAESIPLYAALAKGQPKHELAPQALYMAAFASLAQADYRAAQSYCDEFLKAYPDQPLSAEVRHHLFLACKETLNNIHKHAGATEVWLRMKMNESELELTIEDNGQGFKPTTNQRAGNGLLNLQTRLAAISGHCQVDSQPGRGTCVRLTLKLPKTPSATPHPST